MTWQLVTSTGRAFEIHDGVVLGRSSRADILVDEPKASRQHAQFHLQGDQIVLEDLDSTNGTYVNRVRVKAPLALRAEDQIRVGDMTLSLRWTPDIPLDRERERDDRFDRRSSSGRERREPSSGNTEQRRPSCPSCGSTDVQPASNAGLAAPQPPSDTPLRIVRIFFWVYVVFCSVMILMLLGTFVFGGAVSLLDPTGISAGLMGISGLVSFCFFVPVVALMIGIPWLIKRYFERRYRGRYDQWQRAKSKWSRLSYCEQCAGVFLPGQRRLIPVEQMEAFLFEIGPRAVDF